MIRDPTQSCHNVQHRPVRGDGIRMEILYHGTTLRAATSIFRSREFARADTFFATMGQTWMARIFAARACRSPAEQGAAVVIYLPESMSKAMRSRGMMWSRPFDAEDHLQAVRGKTQLVVPAMGIEMLNDSIEQWYVYGVDPANPRMFSPQAMLHDA